jgi:hypothetical protein
LSLLESSSAPSTTASTAALVSAISSFSSPQRVTASSSRSLMMASAMEGASAALDR